MTELLAEAFEALSALAPAPDFYSLRKREDGCVFGIVAPFDVTVSEHATHYTPLRGSRVDGLQVTSVVWGIDGLSLPTWNIPERLTRIYKGGKKGYDWAKIHKTIVDRIATLRSEVARQEAIRVAKQTSLAKVYEILGASPGQDGYLEHSAYHNRVSVQVAKKGENYTVIDLAPGCDGTTVGVSLRGNIKTETAKAIIALVRQLEG